MNKGFRGLAAVIVAAGVSRRMGSKNKLFASLRGRPLLAWSVDTCQSCDLVRQVVLVMNDDDLPRGCRLKEERHWSKVTLCSGGERRQDSVRLGLELVDDCDLVMVHDAARPFLTTILIEEGLRAVEETGAAIAAVPVKDTIKLAGDGRLVRQTLPRDSLWAAQTPQIFSCDIISRAYQSLAREVTDDAAAVELLGHGVLMYAGDHRNIKVTTVEDLALARIIARDM